jgi:hypothetical protein
MEDGAYAAFRPELLDMPKAHDGALRGREAERARVARAAALTCPLCHRPAIKVASRDGSVTTFEVQCTGCLQGSTLSYLPLDDDDAF